MREYPKDKYDHKELGRLNAAAWMVALLKLNPDYTCWGPGEDYMKTPDEKGGWDSAVLVNSAKEFEWGLDDMNECVHFYFSVERASQSCVACEGSGYSPEAKKIADLFYDLDWGGYGQSPRAWNNKITQDELDALHKHGCCSNYDKATKKWVPDGRTVEQVNADNTWSPGQRGKGFLESHDAINRGILIEARCERLGISRVCAQCEGHGYIFTEPRAHVELVLWVLHPRKGAARGVVVKRVEQDDLPKLFTWLKDADDRNRARFSKVRRALKNFNFSATTTAP